MIIRNGIQKRSMWKLGKIIELLKSAEGHIWTAKLNLATQNSAVRSIVILNFSSFLTLISNYTVYLILFWGAKIESYITKSFVTSC